MKRREFLSVSALMLTLLSNRSVFGLPNLLKGSNKTFEAIMNAASRNNWMELPINQIIGEVSQFFLAKPYTAGTLEINDTEQCIINLDGLDCVTFFENSLNIARIIKLGTPTIDALTEQITNTRYRDGKIDGYTSRLHYTSDWIYDNVKKNIVQDISKMLGGKKIKFNLSFMSANPNYYKQLKNNPYAVKEMKGIEQEINKREYYFIPNSNIESIEDQLLTGDIIAIVNTDKGLDYSHTGLIYKDETAHFMHASTVKKKVIIDVSISKYLLNSKKSNFGISVLRPLEPEINEAIK